MVEVSHSSPLEFKGTLLETGAGGPGGGLIPPAYDPGIVSKLFEPLGLSDVFGSSQTTASQMRYVVEGTATSAAAGVAEGAAKPESTLAYSEVVEPIKKIATVLPISDEPTASTGPMRRACRSTTSPVGPTTLYPGLA